MTRVYALTNHKGGVGKSTSATNIVLDISAMLRNAGASNPLQANSLELHGKHINFLRQLFS